MSNLIKFQKNYSSNVSDSRLQLFKQKVIQSGDIITYIDRYEDEIIIDISSYKTKTHLRKIYGNIYFIDKEDW